MIIDDLAQPLYVEKNCNKCNLKKQLLFKNSAIMKKECITNYFDFNFFTGFHCPLWNNKQIA